MKVENTIIANLREDYTAKTLGIKDVLSNPFEQFGVWLQEALNAEVIEPNAMTLATVAADGMPSARIVLLKGYSEKGFVFYTNYDSDKGKEMAGNPNVALVFVWLDLQRQVRIQGKVVKISEEESSNYFQSRPKGSQISAIASPQSQVVANRQVLEQNFEKIAKEFEGVQQLPRPQNWGGYCVIPSVVEFWQGRRSRLHDRMVYTLEGNTWKIERLAP
jgi:pyridoxamine 5'-phosphate oxidase